LTVTDSKMQVTGTFDAFNRVVRVTDPPRHHDYL
jgi:hypothetical protein